MSATTARVGNADAPIKLADFEDNWLNGVYEDEFKPVVLASTSVGTRVLVRGYLRDKKGKRKLVDGKPVFQRQSLLITDLVPSKQTLAGLSDVSVSPSDQDVLYYKAVTAKWQNQPVQSLSNFAHALLSAQHSDANPAAVAAGDLVYGKATPKWDRLPVGATWQKLSVSSGGLPYWADALRGKVVTKTASYAPTNEDFGIYVNSNSAVTITLPNASSPGGQILYIKKSAGTGDLVLNRQGANLIEGSGGGSLTTLDLGTGAGVFVVLVSDPSGGGVWRVLSQKLAVTQLYMLSADDVQASATVPASPTITSIKTFTLPGNSYANVKVHGDGFVSFTGASLVQELDLGVTVGGTIAGNILPVVPASAAVRNTPFSFDVDFVQLATATLAVFVAGTGLNPADPNTTVTYNNMTVYGAF